MNRKFHSRFFTISVILAALVGSMGSTWGQNAVAATTIGLSEVHQEMPGVSKPRFDGIPGNAGLLATFSLSTTEDWKDDDDQASAYFGFSVGTAGDVNNDGYDDIIVGAHGSDYGQTEEGRAYVYYGSASGLSATPDWIAELDVYTAEFGYSVGTDGDVNNDGYTDVIIGARRYTNGNTYEGGAFVYYGSASGLSTTPDWSAEGNEDYAWFGVAVGTAGDVNNDGYSDVIVGVANTTSAGSNCNSTVYVYHGSATGLATSPSWTESFTPADACFGFAVGTAGDVNNDNYADVIIGAPYYSNDQAHEGAVFVYHGSASGLSATANWTVESNQEEVYFGISVSTAGDITNDGYDDVLVGAPYYTNGESAEGMAFLYSGSGSGLSTTSDWTTEINQINAYFASKVGSAGDVNHDGYSDVLIGAPNYDNGSNDEGGAFLYLGSASGLSASPDWSAEGNSSFSYFGSALGTAGDVNGNGVSDVIVGAYGYEINFNNFAGRAYVYHDAIGHLVFLPVVIR